MCWQGLTQPLDGRSLLLKSAALRPDDAAIAFALALVSKTPDTQPHLVKARAAAKQDRLLATQHGAASDAAVGPAFHRARLKPRPTSDWRRRET